MKKYVKAEVIAKNLPVAAESRKVAERLYNLSVSHFQSGLVSSTDLLQAEASYLQAVTTEADALASYRKALSAYTALFGE